MNDAGNDSGFAVSVRLGESGYLSRIAAGEHELIGDEPASAGGTDEGPNPYELLLTALGTCKTMTMRMYAERKGWNLTGATVRLDHGRVHAEDCDDCESKEGKVDEIETLIELEGDLTDEQRERLREIADKCPVHKSLTSETKIRTRLA